ncbi:hypothetical protein [Streptomyces sp. NPDC053427]|uniref:hypothetical protein n=1 Tax=Streptomyces sp. NPDC053427 TaxID=3365701 RepID=UPI0037D4E951
MTNNAYPFADGRNLVWELTGFDTRDELVDCIQLTREQFLRIRHLFDRGADVWMMAGVHPVDPGLRRPMEEILGAVRFREGVDYFLGARQDLPAGGLWSPSTGTQAPGPVPPP